MKSGKLAHLTIVMAGAIALMAASIPPLDAQTTRGGPGTEYPSNGATDAVRPNAAQAVKHARKPHGTRAAAAQARKSKQAAHSRKARSPRKAKEKKNG